MLDALYTKTVVHGIFPLHERLKGHDSVEIRAQLEKSQWLSSEKIQELQNKRLARFIQHISYTVPYYKQLLADNGLTFSDITTKQDLARLPFLTKSVITKHFEQLKNQQSGKVTPFTTGGSSGTPLTFLLSNERISHDVAEKWRATRWWGVDIGDKEIVAWGSPIELTTQDKIKELRDKLLRTQLLPAFDLTEQKVLDFLNTIQIEKPKMLFGYPSVYYLLAQTAQKHQIPLNNLGIKVIFVTSERLYPYQRELIQQVFNAPVANGYGGRDAGFIAHECPDGSMHLSAEDIVVEIIDDNGKPLPDGEQGEIVVTHLATSDFPFVRYKTGDIGAISTSPCSCGRGLPILEKIEGRSTDFVVAADGTKMHGLALIYVIRELSGISHFKIIQKNLTETQIQLVTTNEYTPETEKTIITGLKARLGQDVAIHIDYLEEIKAEKSGKYRYVVSEISE
ncbi:AMP-binding protein [Vibrio sp. Of7-15]|uniref:phenylacetate--CoA ligase family protein n=1 Tax=Vibrio sp. Of7-15 TaxID=2724879 RepID=UPI001EF3061D|nr:AMP-binding protein [Vibrio sp. Of7-15]MCG7495347.1 AMP-binding protein [Vibrio sp. Of7-15]